MKKLMALIALVAMVAVSSVAFAQDTDPVVVTAEVSATQTITGCNTTITGITPLTKPSATCQSTYTTNDAAGYRLSFSSTSANLSSGSTSDSIAGLNETTTPAGVDTCSAGADCFSWYLSAKSDATATVVADTNGQGSFDANEHAVETSAEEFANHVTTQLTGATVTQTFYATVDDTTQSATDYTNNATIAIGTY